MFGTFEDHLNPAAFLCHNLDFLEII